MSAPIPSMTHLSAASCLVHLMLLLVYTAPFRVAETTHVFCLNGPVQLCLSAKPHPSLKPQFREHPSQLLTPGA